MNARNLRGQTAVMAAVRGDPLHRLCGMRGTAAAIQGAGAAGTMALLRRMLPQSTVAGLEDTLVRLGAALDAMPCDASAGVADVDARDGDGWTAVPTQ